MPQITPAVAESLTAADVYAVQNALPPRFQSNAAWNANLAIINSLRQSETTNGALKFPGLQDNPPMLLGRNMYENSNMDGTFDAAATANNYLLLYGDFQQFVIVDRIGSTIELVPHLFGANRRPTGQRGALLWFRTGSNVVVPQHSDCFLWPPPPNPRLMTSAGGPVPSSFAVRPRDQKGDPHPGSTPLLRRVDPPILFSVADEPESNCQTDESDENASGDEIPITSKKNHAHDGNGAHDDRRSEFESSAPSAHYRARRFGQDLPDSAAKTEYGQCHSDVTVHCWSMP